MFVFFKISSWFSTIWDSWLIFYWSYWMASYGLIGLWGTWSKWFVLWISLYLVVALKFNIGFEFGLNWWIGVWGWILVWLNWKVLNLLVSGFIDDRFMISWYWYYIWTVRLVDCYDCGRNIDFCKGLYREFWGCIPNFLYFVFFL